MTINVGLVTSDALVLGCDSIASSTSPMIDPSKMEFQKDGNSNPKLDENGNPLVAFKPENVQMVVTDFKSGVTKMFSVFEVNGAFAGATTAGLAKVNDKPIANLAKEFKDMYESHTRPFANIDAITRAFLSFFRSRYEKDFQDTSIPEQYWPELEFLVGGIGRDDSFPSLYRVNVKKNTVEQEFHNGTYGVSWAGQSGSVERLLLGADSFVKGSIKNEFDNYEQLIKGRVLEIVQELLDHFGESLPAHIDTSFPEKPSMNDVFDQGRIDIDYANLPLQDAVDLVSFLVNMQAGQDKFTRGPATVGGRVHIGLVSKSLGDGFTRLNEPELQHEHTGFSND